VLVKRCFSKQLSGSSHIFVFWFLVDSYQKTKISAVIFFCLLIAEKINFLLVNQQKISQLKLGLRSWKKGKTNLTADILVFW